jgi:hypothetical protein
MAKSSGGGGRAGRGRGGGVSASGRREIFSRLSQGRPVSVRTPGGTVTIENAPRGVRQAGYEFVATAQRGYGNGFIDSKAAFRNSIELSI